MKNTRTNFRIVVLISFIPAITSLLLSAFIEERQVAEVLRVVGLVLLGSVIVQAVLFYINPTSFKSKKQVK